MSRKTTSQLFCHQNFCIENSSLLFLFLKKKQDLQYCFGCTDKLQLQSQQQSMKMTKIDPHSATSSHVKKLLHTICFPFLDCYSTPKLVKKSAICFFFWWGNASEICFDRFFSLSPTTDLCLFFPEKTTCALKIARKISTVCWIHNRFSIYISQVFRSP